MKHTQNRKVIFFSLLFAPSICLGLSPGRIEVDSFLFQPLHAEIEIAAARTRELNTLSINLAKPEVFRQHGLMYHPALEKLKFRLKRDAHNQSYIEVLTQESVDQLAISFLLELTWNSGKILRQYDIFLEPQNTKNAVKHTRQGNKRLLKDSKEAQTEVGDVIVMQSTENGNKKKTNGSNDRQNRRNQSQSFNTNNGRYGPIRPGESLSMIAMRARPDKTSMSLQQVMVALYEANPHAFTSDNMGSLEAGHMLFVPDNEMILSLPKSQALAIVDSHYNPSKKQQMTKRDSSTENKVSKDANRRDGKVIRLSIVEPDEIIEQKDTTQFIDKTDDVQILQARLAQTRQASEQLKQHNEELKQKLEALLQRVNNLQARLGQQNPELAKAPENTKPSGELIVLGSNLNTIGRTPHTNNERQDSSNDFEQTGIIEQPIVESFSVNKGSSILAGDPQSLTRKQVNPRFIEQVSNDGAKKGLLSNPFLLTALGGLSAISIALLGFGMHSEHNWWQSLLNRFRRNRRVDPNVDLWR